MNQIILSNKGSLINDNNKQADTTESPDPHISQTSMQHGLSQSQTIRPDRSLQNI